MRAILHSDLNSFYASVECMLDPSLKGKAVAVCGSTEDRHGIVLAKSELAKKAGIKTGMVNWEARQRCPGLIIVPPQYDQYLKYSKLVREIYQRYTDCVEPYGMDESWLDITGSAAMGAPMEIAEKIRKTTREELGLTVSIGVSYNKVFAKLGSDMKKPDAITQITPDDMKTTVWPLPACELLYMGRATTRKLMDCGVRTIGDVAKFPIDLMQAKLGKNGLLIWAYANGMDTSRVMHQDYHFPVKSIGHGITCNADLDNEEDVWKVLLFLSQDIGHRLRVHEKRAKGVQLTIKDNELQYRQIQTQLPFPTQSPSEIALTARKLFTANYRWLRLVRALTVRAINLIPADTPAQLDLFGDHARRAKLDALEDAIYDIRSRFGENAIKPALLLGEMKIAGDAAHEVTMPGAMYR